MSEYGAADFIANRVNFDLLKAACALFVSVAKWARR
jgi:hypothetical protein